MKLFIFKIHYPSLCLNYYCVELFFYTEKCSLITKELTLGARTSWRLVIWCKFKIITNKLEC